MKKTFRTIVSVAAIAILAASVSSCNRGYGCPNNFSVEDQTVQAVKIVTNVIAATVVKD